MSWGGFPRPRPGRRPQKDLTARRTGRVGAGALLAAGCLLAGACEDADPLGRREVSGTVRLDGELLESGVIHFEPQAGGGQATGTVIRDGRFELPAEHGLPPGTYTVSISSPEPTGQEPSMDEYVPAPPERIPKQYNVKTTLTAEVTPAGANRFEFDLQTGGSQ